MTDAPTLCPHCASSSTFHTGETTWMCANCSWTWADTSTDLMNAQLMRILSIPALMDAPPSYGVTSELAELKIQLSEGVKAVAAGVVLADKIMVERDALRREIRRLKSGMIELLTTELYASDAQAQQPGSIEASYFSGKRACALAIIAEISKLFGYSEPPKS